MSQPTSKVNPNPILLSLLLYLFILLIFLPTSTASLTDPQSSPTPRNYQSFSNLQFNFLFQLQMTQYYKIVQQTHIAVTQNFTETNNIWDRYLAGNITAIDRNQLLYYVNDSRMVNKNYYERFEQGRQSFEKMREKMAPVLEELDAMQKYLSETGVCINEDDKSWHRIQAMFTEILEILMTKIPDLMKRRIADLQNQVNACGMEIKEQGYVFEHVVDFYKVYDKHRQLDSVTLISGLCDMVKQYIDFKGKVESVVEKSEKLLVKFYEGKLEQAIIDSLVANQSGPSLREQLKKNITIFEVLNERLRGVQESTLSMALQFEKNPVYKPSIATELKETNEKLSKKNSKMKQVYQKIVQILNKKYLQLLDISTEPRPIDETQITKVSDLFFQFIQLIKQLPDLTQFQNP